MSTTLDTPGALTSAASHVHDTSVGDRSSTALATRIAELVVEVLNGRRSVHTLRDHLDGPVFTWLATQRPPRAHQSNYRLRSVHACLTDNRTVEACWVLGTPYRVRALVSRVRRDQHEWRCTLLRPV